MNQQTNKFYDHVSYFYPVIDVFLRGQKRALFEEINKVPAGHILEIGVGNGAHLKNYKDHKVTGIDSSPKMLSMARKSGTNAELLQMNGEVLLFEDNCFDYVVLSHVIAVVDDPGKVLQEVYRVLKPGGKIFVLNHFTPDNWLRYVDRSFGSVSRRFHFKSHFRESDLKELSRFSLLKAVQLGPLSYFKLLIYQKP